MPAKGKAKAKADANVKRKRGRPCKNGSFGVCTKNKSRVNHDTKKKCCHTKWALKAAKTKAKPKAKAKPKTKPKAKPTKAKAKVKKTSTSLRTCLEEHGGYKLGHDLSSDGTIKLASKNRKMYVVKVIKKLNVFLVDSEASEFLWSKHKIGPGFYGFFECGRRGVLVMDRWDGSLDEIVGVKPSKTLKDKLIAQLKKIHGEGLLHGDIKAANIFYKRDVNGRLTDVTLADFGKVKLNDQRTKFTAEIAKLRRIL